MATAPNARTRGGLTSWRAVSQRVNSPPDCSTEQTRARIARVSASSAVAVSAGADIASSVCEEVAHRVESLSETPCTSSISQNVMITHSIYRVVRQRGRGAPRSASLRRPLRGCLQYSGRTRRLHLLSTPYSTTLPAEDSARPCRRRRHRPPVRPLGLEPTGDMTRRSRGAQHGFNVLRHPAPVQRACGGGLKTAQLPETPHDGRR